MACTDSELVRRGLERSHRAPNLTFLEFILVAALLLRVGWVITRTGVIENEGAEYATIASNLFHHATYVGILGGREALFPPLYPVLIGLVSFVTHNTEIAGRAVSVIMGTLFVASLYLLALRIFGRRTAYVTAILAAVHPLLLAMSSSVYSEMTYLAMLFTASYFALKALENPGLSSGSLAGLFFGLAYLTRPEGLGHAAVAAFILLVSVRFRQDASVWSALKGVASMAIVTAIVASPYVAYLSINSGSLHLEGKTAVNDLIYERMDRGMSYPEAATGIGPDLSPQGPWMYVDQFSVLQNQHGRLSSFAKTYVTHFVYLRAALTGIAARKSFGFLLLPLLAVIGLLRPTWKRNLLGESMLLAMAVVTVLALLTVKVVYGRYYFPVLPFVVLWASAGIDTLAQALGHFVRARLGPALLRFGCIALIVCLAYLGLRHEPELTETSSVYLRSVGTWMQSQQGSESKKIMSIGSVLPYYAGGTLEYLPYADATHALAYIHKTRPDFIVLDINEITRRPYGPDWIRGHIPDSCAREIGDFAAQGPRVIVYRWTCDK